MSNPNPTLRTENLKPFKSGADPRRNTKGRPKGSFNLSTIIKELMDDPALADMVVSKKRPLWWNGLPEKRFAEAVVMAQIIKAMSGDTRAFNALAKAAFGDKISHEVEEEIRLISVMDIGQSKAGNKVS